MIRKLLIAALVFTLMGVVVGISFAEEQPTSVTFYLFLLITPDGPTGALLNTEEECKAALVEALSHLPVILASTCAPVTLMPIQVGKGVPL